MLHQFDDIHRHRLGDADPTRVVVNLEPGQQPDGSGWFSAGIHPWMADRADEYWQWLEEVLAHPRVLAVGEAGLDALRGPDQATQTRVFERQAELSERFAKPLIIHAVRSWPALTALRRRLKPSQPWIIHGFRGKPELARQLLDQGFSLSFGHRFNPDSYALTPPERRYSETDFGG